MEKEQQPTSPSNVEAAPSSPEKDIPLEETSPEAEPSDLSSRVFVVQRDENAPPATLQDIERAYVTWMLRVTHGNRTAASRMLGISYPTIMKKIIDYHIDYRSLGTRRAKR
ncbi:MAG TPA: helix-turn-helix domain-containing protein [Polyangia bacterium]